MSVGYRVIGDHDGIAVSWKEGVRIRENHNSIVIIITILTAIIGVALSINMANPAFLILSALSPIAGQIYNIFGRSDKERIIIFHKDGSITSPNGTPDFENTVEFKNTRFHDIAEFKASPLSEWNSKSREHQDARHWWVVLLERKDGAPIFLSNGPNARAYLQPVVVALDRAYDEMLPHIVLNSDTSGVTDNGTGSVQGKRRQ